MPSRKSVDEWYNLLSDEFRKAVIGRNINVSRIAREQGVSRNTVYRYLKMFFGDNYRNRVYVFGVYVDEDVLTMECILRDITFEDLMSNLKEAGWSNQRILEGIGRYLAKMGYVVIGK